ncbi:hypothetical protein BGZ46_006107, partial [Entomortierella lignicola]
MRETQAQQEHTAATRDIIVELQQKVDKKHAVLKKETADYNRRCAKKGLPSTKIINLITSQYQDDLDRLKQVTQLSINRVNNARASTLEEIALYREQSLRDIQERFQARQRARERIRHRGVQYPERPLTAAAQRLLAPMMETSEDGQIQLGPVWLSPTEAAAVTEMSQAQVDSSLPRVISTDGSFINAGTPQAAMAFGVVDQSGIIPQVVRGRTDGHASSTKAELMGLLAAILATPSEQDVQIELDNKSVVQQYQQLVHSRADTLP